jgi:hypothetical protein
MVPKLRSKSSFSPYRKWGIALHVCFIIFLVLSAVVMVNYISRDYFLRLYVSTRTRIELAPRTVGLLKSLTNEVKVTLYYDTQKDALYSTVVELLKEYSLVNPRISVQAVDYLLDPGAAQKVKADTSSARPRTRTSSFSIAREEWKRKMAVLWHRSLSSKSQPTRKSGSAAR